jgi:hypothetical protein
MSHNHFCARAIEKPYDIPVLHNTRILAYPGMRTSTLFTARNFSLIAKFARFIHDSRSPETIKDVLFLILTSAVASCSRLIAYRDNMKGGGPAWTVPGFWVPPLHIERNPLSHLKARYSKLEKGLAALGRQLKSSQVSVYLDDSEQRLRKLRQARTQVQYIFADPPYGDSVPFLEFCQIWNCWDQRVKPEFTKEVVVSDRIPYKSYWYEYEQRLTAVMRQCGKILADDGHLTVTFNNLEIRAWHALLSALQRARFECTHVTYQIPAVVSAKASFAPTSSYVGDVYATFARASNDLEYRPWPIVERRLAKASTLRGGAVSRVTQLKVAALTILEKNVDAQCFVELDQHFLGLPAKTPPIPRDSRLYEQIRKAMEEAVANSSGLTDAQLCAAVVKSVPDWLGLDQHEIIGVANSAGFERTKNMWRPKSPPVREAAGNHIHHH